MTADEVFVALVPSGELKSVRRRIEEGEPLRNVVGEHVTSVSWQSVRKISADSCHTDLHLEFAASETDHKTLRLRLPDESAREEAWEAARYSLPGNVDQTERVGSRLVSARRPLLALMICSLLAAGTQWFFQSRYAKVPQQVVDTVKNGQKRQTPPRPSPKRLDINNPDDLRKIKFYRGNQAGSSHFDPAQRGIARGLSRNPALARVIVFGIAILGAVGFVLGLMGYQLSLSLFVGLSVACLCWLMARLLSPPRSVTLTHRPE